MGSTNAAASNEISALGWARAVSSSPTKLIGSYLSTESIAICPPKHDPSFVQAFNNAVAGVLVSGEAERVYKEWLGTDGLGLPLNQLTRETYRLPSTFGISDNLL